LYLILRDSPLRPEYTPRRVPAGSTCSRAGDVEEETHAVLFTEMGGLNPRVPIVVVLVTSMKRRVRISPGNETPRKFTSQGLAGERTRRRMLPF
jgi:hypothetical protein